MKRWERVAAGILVGLVACSAQAAASFNERIVQVCLADAARVFHVPALAVRVLRRVEGGGVGTSSPNTDGSVDLGPMQVNSSWLSTLRPLGIDAAMLRDNPCINAYVGAWIFSQTYAESRGQTALAMARYHSHNPAEQRRYLNLVLRAIDKMSVADK